MQLMLNRSGRRVTRIFIVGLVLVGLVIASSCGGGSDDNSANSGALIEVLPDDGDLGAGWVRVTEPRIGDPAESLDICGVQLNEGMIDGAKIDLANDREDFASTFFRRYDDADAAADALREASMRIAECPAGAVNPGQSAQVATLPTPDAGDSAYSALFTFPPTDASLSEEFGWALVQTGDVVRSLTYSPAEPRSTTADELRRLAEAIAITG